MIKLKPQDWLWATWRPYTPLPRPEPRPFDLQDLRSQINALSYEGPYQYWWQPVLKKLPPIISHEEAHFWIVFHELTLQNLRVNDPQFDVVDYGGEVERARVIQLINDLGGYRDCPEFAVVLSALFSPEDQAEIICTSKIYGGIWPGFRKYVLPYLTEKERERIRQLIRHVLNASEPNTLWIPLYIAAAVGGLSKEIEPILPKLYGWQSWRYMSQIYAHEQMPLVLFGLDDPAKVERYARQLGCDFWTRDHVIGWLVHTETRALDWIVASINSAPTKAIAETLFGALKLVDDEVVSLHMLELEKSPIGMLASKWLNEHPEWVARGAARAVFTGSQTAEAYLKRLRGQGGIAQLQAVQMVLPSELRAEFQRRFIDTESNIPSPLTEEDTPVWLKEALVLPAKKKAPDWVSMADLPPLLVDGHPLNVEQGKQLLTALSLSTLEGPHPIIDALKAHLSSSMLDTFAWKLFELWLSHGAPIKEKWGLSTVGLLGNDTSAMKLPPIISQWPTVTLYKRIELGLACLGAIGSDIALMQIHRIAQKAEQGGLKYRAREAMQNIAASRNLSEDQLKDRIIPDCGLNANGQHTFDYGPRRFTFVLSPDLKPFVRDESGKIKADLPKPGVRDDAALAQEAFDTWKLLKKQIREVVKLETERLHSALIDRRRWSLDEFEMFFVRHPLMIHLVQRLLWGTYDSSGKLNSAFRVTSEHDYADIGDSVITLDQRSGIGLVHPIDMEEVETWKQIFNDYEIISPFPQLVRPVCTLLPDELDTVEINRYAGIEIETLVLAGVFRRLHWNADNPISHGYTVTFFKRFPAQNVIAIIRLDPGYMDFDPRSADNQHIKACYFISAEAAKDSYEYYRLTEKVRLGDVDPLAISEVLSDLAVIDSRKIITT